MTDDQISQRKSDQYHLLPQEEESIIGGIGDQEMGTGSKYNRGPNVYSGWLKNRCKSKLKYLIIALILAIITFWATWDLLWPQPAPIVWSDEMTKMVYPKSADHLKERLVHLDLKGAPPRVEYLKRIFPLFRAWGATGLLIEWEDMYPYHGELEKMRHGDAYDDKSIKAILEAAKAQGLTVIPLIQTFGHMEWVLKKQQYKDVREITRYPQVICPTNNRSLNLVKALIDDLVSLHKGYIDSLHIGADEAYNVATECSRCKRRMELLGGKLDKLMLEYVSKVARYVKEKHGLKVLMWNDMYEKTEVEVLRSYRMHELVEPVIWGYAENLMKADYFAPGIFERFGQVFEKQWIASAFKGANGPDQAFVDVRKYAQNHLSWLQVLNYYKKPMKSAHGIILTGWQRFDHFAILCELLPAAIPSLVFNLRILQEGGMEPKIFDTTRKALNCKPTANWTLDVPEWSLMQLVVDAKILRIKPPERGPILDTLKCEFPGSEVYVLIERLRLLKHIYDKLMNTSVVHGWLNEYNRHHEYSSILFAETIYNITEPLITHFRTLAHELQEELSKIYYDDTVNEWLYVNIQEPVDKLKPITLAALQIKQTVEFRNRPLSSMKLDL